MQKNNNYWHSWRNPYCQVGSLPMFLQAQKKVIPLQADTSSQE